MQSIWLVFAEEQISLLVMSGCGHGHCTTYIITSQDLAVAPQEGFPQDSGGFLQSKGLCSKATVAAAAAAVAAAAAASGATAASESVSGGAHEALTQLAIGQTPDVNTQGQGRP